MRDRAARAGFDARAVGLGDGVVEIHLRFRSDADFFAPPRSDWVSLVFDDVGITRPLVRLVVEAPDGSPTFVAGRGVCYSTCGASPTSPGTPLVGTARARTRLDVVVRDDGGQRAPIDVEVCGPSDGATAALCDAFGTDRYGLAPPQVSDAACAGVVEAPDGSPTAAGPTVGVRGTIDGVAVDLSYGIGSCTGGTVERWIRLLTDSGVMPVDWLAGDA